jgi:hypothetical protein
LDTISKVLLPPLHSPLSPLPSPISHLPSPISPLPSPLSLSPPLLTSKLVWGCRFLDKGKVEFEIPFHQAGILGNLHELVKTPTAKMILLIEVRLASERRGGKRSRRPMAGKNGPRLCLP